jgi:hypothetical protein
MTGYGYPKLVAGLVSGRNIVQDNDDGTLLIQPVVEESVEVGQIASVESIEEPVAEEAMLSIKALLRPVDEEAETEQIALVEPVEALLMRRWKSPDSFAEAAVGPKGEVHKGSQGPDGPKIRHPRHEDFYRAFSPIPASLRRS